MSKWIRWWGVVAFIIAIILIFCVWYMLVDKIIANNIEQVGEFVVGADVEVGKADLTIFPLGITLENLLVADPNSPMHNLIDVDNISFHLDGKHLFDRKVIIKDMVVEGIKFNTARKKSGKIEGAKPLTVKRGYDEFILPLLDLSKLKTFVEQENLQSIDGLNALKEDILRIDNEWRISFRMMPNIEDVHNYQKRSNIIITDIENNRVKGLITHAKNIKVLKEELGRDIEQIKINKRAMLIDIDSLTTKKNRALGYIDTDIAKLRKKYTIDKQGLKNFSKYIFKDDIIKQFEDGLLRYNKYEKYFNYVYKQLKSDTYGTEPILYKGIDVHFPEFDPQPSFYIELAKLSYIKSASNIVWEMNNFTTQQNITGLPTTIKFDGYNLNFAKSLNIFGSVNHIDKNNINDDLKVSIKGQKIKMQDFQIVDNWGISFTNGEVDKSFLINIHKGKINSKLNLKYSGISINSNFTGSKNLVISSIDSTLKRVSDFYVEINISGAPGDYNITINSDLDNIIEKAVRKIIDNEANKVKNTISRIINDKKAILITNIESEIEKLTLELVKVEELHANAKKILYELP